MSGIIEIGTIAPALLVLGAGGQVGGGVVQAAVEAGWPVLAVDQDTAALEALQLRHPDAGVVTLQATIHCDADAAQLAAQLQARVPGGIGAVVASIGGRHPCARLLDQPADMLRDTLDQDLMPQLFAARHLLPLLPRDGTSTYLLIGGPAGDYPWAGYGHCSIAAAALRMMVRVLHDEAAGQGVRVQLLALDAPVHTEANTTWAGAAWPRALAVGKRALAMLDPGRTRASPVVDYRIGHANPSDALLDAPARHLRDARALLASIPSLPLLHGRLPHETP